MLQYFTGWSEVQSDGSNPLLQKRKTILNTRHISCLKVWGSIPNSTLIDACNHHNSSLCDYEGNYTICISNTAKSTLQWCTINEPTRCIYVNRCLECNVQKLNYFLHLLENSSSTMHSQIETSKLITRFVLYSPRYLSYVSTHFHGQYTSMESPNYLYQWNPCFNVVEGEWIDIQIWQL